VMCAPKAAHNKHCGGGAKGLETQLGATAGRSGVRRKMKGYVIVCLAIATVIAAGSCRSRYPVRVLGERGVSPAAELSVLELAVRTATIGGNSSQVGFLSVEKKEPSPELIRRLSDHKVLIRPLSEKERWTSVLSDSNDVWNQRGYSITDSSEVFPVDVGVSWASEEEAVVSVRLRRVSYQTRAHWADGQWTLDKPTEFAAEYGGKIYR
jgi:hypothetical protein